MSEPTPAVAQSVPAETALRDRILQALADALKPRYGGPQHNTPGGLPLTATAEEARLHRAQPLADAVLAVLPAANRAAVYRELADRQTQLAVAVDLQCDRAMATARRQLVKELRRLVVEAQQQTETQAEIVHGCPPDGSGLTPCCGRTPFELPLGDRISSEAPITCPGPAAGAQQPKETSNPRTVCVCGHTKGEHLTVSGRLLCDACDPDSTDNLVCRGFDAL